jgi:hypothetical protein
VDSCATPARFLRNSIGESRLADPSFPAQEKELSAAGRSAREPLPDLCQLPLSADERDRRSDWRFTRLFRFWFRHCAPGSSWIVPAWST